MWGIHPSAAIPGAFGYRAKYGYWRDGESGFYMCTYRSYDPGSGRFITRDPIGFDGGPNLYGYVGNDPVNFTDPDGLAPLQGHHIVPQALWRNAPQAIKDVFHNARYRIADRMYNSYDFKDYANITERTYRNAVDSELNNYITSLGKNCVNDLTPVEARTFAERILFTQGGIIGAYNAAVRKEMQTRIMDQVFVSGFLKRGM